MSPNISTNRSWDPKPASGSIKMGLHGRKVCPVMAARPSPTRGKFITGPIDVPWVCSASRLGVKALLVGLALWHLKGLRKADTFVVSNLMVRDWSIEPDAKRRGLRALEMAGLIRVQRRGKRSPLVTIVLGPSGIR